MPRPLFRNFYTCPECDAEWDDTWCACCDDDCPECGLRHITPEHSAELAELCDHDDCEPEPADDPNINRCADCRALIGVGDPMFHLMYCDTCAERHLT